MKKNIWTLANEDKIEQEKKKRKHFPDLVTHFELSWVVTSLSLQQDHFYPVVFYYHGLSYVTVEVKKLNKKERSKRVRL